MHPKRQTWRLRAPTCQLDVTFGLVLVALKQFSVLPQIIYAAVDCTKGHNHELCKQEGVEGYPTFNHYNYGKFVEKYNGERGVSARP